MGVQLSEAKFIQLGLIKEKWPHVTVETVQQFLDDPTWLDAESNQAFVENFFHYYGWYWRSI